MVHNTINSLNLDEGHDIDEQSEGGTIIKIPNGWFVFQSVMCDRKSSGI